MQRFELYHEAGPQLLLQAHLQRIVSGGGRNEREYALDRGRTDLLIVFDRAPERSWEEKIFHRQGPPDAGAPVTVWGM